MFTHVQFSKMTQDKLEYLVPLWNLLPCHLLNRMSPVASHVQELGLRLDSFRISEQSPSVLASGKTPNLIKY